MLEPTIASKAHASVVRDWSTLYLDEVNGFFDAQSEDIQDAFVQLYELQHPDKPRPHG
jgi:hypothetical protein